MGGIKDAIKIIDKTPEEIEQIKAGVNKSGLPEESKTVAIYGLNLILWLPKLLLEQKITIARLKELLFGKGPRRQKDTSKDTTPNSDKVAPNANKEGESPGDAANDDLDNNTILDDNESTSGEDNNGRNGRNPHTAYKNATEHRVTIEGLEPGQPCPKDCGGKLYTFRPSTVIRIKGSQMACAHRYIIEKLRCNLCGEIVSAEPPSDMGDEKYDASFVAQLGIQKYYMGMPSYRQACFHSFIDVPMPHTTQWMLLEKLAGCVFPVFNHLCQLVANHHLLYYDDTPVKIVDEIRDNRLNPNKKRKGMFTTGILAKFDTHQIMLYFNGTQHAGENLDKLLSKRTSKDRLMLMSDALSRNTPVFENIVQCYCLSHAYRKFEELIDFYTTPCMKVTALISHVYKIDRQTKNMTPSQRLKWHNKESGPIMDKLHADLTRWIDERLVEPNDSLGKAIAYTLNHWHELTQFLRLEGAPLDNNELEQRLKVAIRGRKNWLFYKNSYGASIGGVMTSVIHSCLLSNVNPHQYLIALQENKDHVVKEPQAYLPWNYQQARSLELSSAA